jgi:putative membrane protein
MKSKKNIILQSILWIIQGCIVGVGAILPGVSGGTLCYAFGIYNPIIEVLSNPIKGIKKYWYMLIFVFLGVGVGFVGFAGITESLLKWNAPVVMCAFIGLILGTVPELWKDSGAEGRNKYSIVSFVLSFIFIAVLFYCCEHVWDISIPATFVGYLICGVVWGLSFIVPGFSSSTLLLFFGIYGAMSAGIKSLDFGVIIPLGVALLATMLALSRVMKLVFEKIHSIASHSVMGFVLATTVMLFSVSEDGAPSIIETFSGMNIVIYVLCILGGAVASFLFSRACNKIKALTEKEQ